MSRSVVRADRTGPDGTDVGRVEDGQQAGDAALDPLLVHDVGLVDADLRTGVRLDVVDLHDERRPGDERRRSPSCPVSGRDRQRLGRRRGRGRRSWWWWSPRWSASGPRRPRRRRRREAACHEGDGDAAGGQALLRGIEQSGQHGRGHSFEVQALSRLPARPPPIADPGASRRPHSSRSRAMRSSSGGWVSNRRLRRDIRPSSSSSAWGSSIQRWAVARLWSRRPCSRRAASPGPRSGRAGSGSARPRRRRRGSRAAG